MKKETKGILVVIILVLLLFIGWPYIRSFLPSTSKPTLNADLIEATLEDCSELTTEKMYYKGFITYDEGKIPFLTHNSFSLVFEATISAGIDASEIEYDIDDDNQSITVIIPDAELKEPAVDTNSLEIHDKSFAMLNQPAPDDLIVAQKEAVKSAKAYAEQSDILDRANAQAKTVIKGLVDPIAELSGYKVYYK